MKISQLLATVTEANAKLNGLLAETPNGRLHQSSVSRPISA